MAGSPRGSTQQSDKGNFSQHAFRSVYQMPSDYQFPEKQFATMGYDGTPSLVSQNSLNKSTGLSAGGRMPHPSGNKA